MDWACYRIIDDSIYQWPVVRIPASLHTDLKEISFLGERFFVPNPPEVYLGLKYGREWMIPKRAGSFEREVTGLAVSELVVDGEAHTVDVCAFRHGRFAEDMTVEANIF